MRTYDFVILLTILYFNGMGDEKATIPNIAENLGFTESECKDHVVNLVCNGMATISKECKERLRKVKTPRQQYTGTNSILKREWVLTETGLDNLKFYYMGSMNA